MYLHQVIVLKRFLSRHLQAAAHALPQFSGAGDAIR
jgi:hypothetical protein